MSQAQKCVLLACGGTGGHIFPAFSVAEELKKKHPSIRLVFICGNKDIETAIFRMLSGEKVIPVESAPFRGTRSLFSPSFLLRLLKGIAHSAGILKREKPGVVVGFGGHFSFPVIVAARLLGIRTMIHEQNVMPGFANKVMARWVDAVALSFDDTRRYLPPHRCIRHTGNPIREFIERDCREEALKFFGFSPNKATVLVLGGSQGAESINTVFLETLKTLSAETRASIQVLHLTGKMSTALAEKMCADLGVTSRAFSFFERMDLAYGAADFAIGRAGATFLAESAAKRMPAILVPYPFAGGHQLLNARAFLGDGQSLVIEQKDLTPATLGPELEKFIGKALELRKTGKAPAQNRSQENSRIKLMHFIEERAGWAE